MRLKALVSAYKIALCQEDSDSFRSNTDSPKTSGSISRGKKNIQCKLMKLPDVTTCKNIVMLLLPATLGMYLMGWNFHSDIFPRNKKTPLPPAPQLYKHITPSELFIAPKCSLLCGYITFLKNSLFSPFSLSYYGSSCILVIINVAVNRKISSGYLNSEMPSFDSVLYLRFDGNSVKQSLCSLDANISFLKGESLTE